MKANKLFKIQDIVKEEQKYQKIIENLYFKLPLAQVGESPNPKAVIEQFKLSNAKWTKNGWVCSGNLNLADLGLTKLPKIYIIRGHFDCSYNRLTTPEGTPQKVGGNFDYNNNKLITLQGAPQEIGGDFYCTDNQLTTLQGAPQKIGGSFYCIGNQLTTLQGAPKKIIGDFCCGFNKLTSFRGAPQEIGGDFYCGDNPIKDYSELDRIKIDGTIYK